MKRRAVLVAAPLATAAVLTSLGACSRQEPSPSISDEATTQASSTPPGSGSPSAAGQGTAGDYAVTSEELGFDSDGNRIYGRALRPALDGPLPAIILSHGFAGTYEQESGAQEFVARRGVVVYSFDFAGGASSQPPLSEGEMTSMSVLTEAQNLRDALALVRGLDYVDPERIYLVGVSQGGVVTTLVADENPAGVRGIVLLCPAFSLFDDARSRFPTEADIPETYDLMQFTVGARYFRDVYSMDIYQHMANFTGDVLIIHGTADQVVPFSYAKRAAETFPDATFIPMEGEGHQFSDVAQQPIAEAVLEMIDPA